MADLFVGGVDQAIVKALKKQALANGRSEEAEHIEILKAALMEYEQHGFASMLISIPNVGLDQDFQRVSSACEKEPGSD